MYVIDFWRPVLKGAQRRARTMDLEYLKELPVYLARDQPYVSTFLLALGSFAVVRVVYQTLSVLLQTFIIPGTNLKRFGSTKGAWAVVTGASDGIGKEFAFQLAKAGFNVLLIARNKQLLDSTASDIATKYPGVSTATHSINFAKADEHAYQSLSTVLNRLDVGVLVNNVGKSHAMPAYFVDTPKDEITDIVAINVNATLHVTYAVLPGMVQRKRGLILNIGSFAGAIPSPMLATYSGTKAFLSTFTSALAEEVRAQNITVEHVNTYFVVSKLSKIRKASALIPQPGAFVRSVLSKIGLPCGAGYSGRPGTSTPYWSHSLLDYAATLLGLPSVLISYTHGLHKDIRRRALRKQEREGKKL
ncbi:Very-long-chain 3-oxoacyl-CoA reductase [Hypsizygus marmoreus]|uniref:Very-long-chain 3-oxoacyl-CoA reductase n=1 Tax=Hypsizygus marmoreus TaxID=39966 RepID=A0A369JUL3_HYPMA|nr:Very-long-chain 3-oxoacyl-CoA reductase [Hypsizygus marmoreus]